MLVFFYNMDDIESMDKIVEPQEQKEYDKVESERLE